MIKTVVVLCGLLVSSIVVNLWAFLRVLRPVQRLTARASTLAQGDMNALEQPCEGIREVNELRKMMASMAQHVQRAQAEGLTYRYALTDGQEAERARIAHDLHDETVQSLVAIAQSIELATNWVDTDPQRAKAMLGLARTSAVDTVKGLRRLIADLRPPALEELGIAAGLEMLAGSNHNLPIQVNVTGNIRRLAESHELALFRIAQEAIRNAEKHAKPTQITIDLTFSPAMVRLAVRDDGVGFEPSQALDCLAQEQHFGLLGIQERVQQLHGTFKLSSRLGAGTEIQITLPVSAADQPTEQVRDPVCGAIIEPQRAYGSTVYKGETYFFCCPVCQGTFQRQPETYASSTANLV